MHPHSTCACATRPARSRPRWGSGCASLGARGSCSTSPSPHRPCRTRPARSRVSRTSTSSVAPSRDRRGRHLLARARRPRRRVRGRLGSHRHLHGERAARRRRVVVRAPARQRRQAPGCGSARRRHRPRRPDVPPARRRRLAMGRPLVLHEPDLRRRGLTRTAGAGGRRVGAGGAVRRCFACDRGRRIVWCPRWIC